MIAPMVLGPNQPRQFYAGGEAIADLRGVPISGSHHPEDWVASVTARFGTETEGLSRLPDGGLLRDAVHGDPAGFLGPDHVRIHRSDPGLLVKLLDAGQRLPVHCHPGRAFARSHLGSAHGKTEAWVVLGTRGPAPTVYLGFREAMTRQTLARLVADGASSDLLQQLNPLAVRPGDAILVPAGTPHSIGQGVFVLELQEPTDFSVMLERSGFELPDAGDLGLGGSALDCVDLTGWDADRCAAVRGSSPRDGEPVSDLLPPDAAPYFRAERLVGPAELDPVYAVLVVTSGEGTLETEHGCRTTVRRGSTVLLPYAAGSGRLDGTAEAIRCLPSASEATS